MDLEYRVRRHGGCYCSAGESSLQNLSLCYGTRLSSAAVIQGPFTLYLRNSKTHPNL